MPIIPGDNIAPPEPLRRRPGLFDAASGPLDLTTHGQGGGVNYVPVTCGSAVPYGVNCTEGAVVASPDKDMGTEADQVQSGVFVALSTLQCGAVGYTLPEYRDRVRRQLEGAEQGAVERAFWTGLDADGNALDILSLQTDVTAIFPPAAGVDQITTVLATLEDWLYLTQGYGYAGYVHAPMRFAPYAAEAGLIVPETPSNPNSRLRTPNGSVWVFGGGYPGTGAGGASGWPGGGFLHITGQTTVWRASEISVYDAFNTATNERTLIAERAYAVSYDCHNARAEFNPLNLS